MNKRIYISPCACVCEITGRGMMSTSIKIGSSEEKVSNSEDIGFAKEQNSQEDRGLWNDEW